MKKLLIMASCCAAAICAVIPVVSGAEVTASALIRQDPEASLLWKTVMTPEVEVMLDWPTGATHAVLSVDGAARATVNDASVASTNISFALPSAPADERTVTLSVSYLDGMDALVGSDEVKLGLVCGVDGASAIPFRAADSREWHKAEASSAVLPVLEGATSLSIGGMTVLASPTAPDWYWWHPIHGATVPLALALESGETCANTVRGIAGMRIDFK